MKLTPLHTDATEHQALSAAIKACNAMEKHTNLKPIYELLKKMSPSSEINQWLRENPDFTAEPETQTYITQQAKKLENTLSTFGEKTLAILGLKPIEKDNTHPNTTRLLELISMMDNKHRAAFLDKSRLNITPKELANFNAVDYKTLLTRLKTNTKTMRPPTEEKKPKTSKAPSDTQTTHPAEDNMFDDRRRNDPIKQPRRR